MPARVKLANPQPLVELLYNPYQVAYLEARRRRVCRRGHQWNVLDTLAYAHQMPHARCCPECWKAGIYKSIVDPRDIGVAAFRRLALIAGRRGGKTRIGALSAVEEAAVPGTVGWICAPSFPELEDYAMPAFFQQIPQAWLEHPNADWSEATRTLTLPNLSIVQFRSLDDPERGRGQGLDWLWIDEAAKLAKKAWDVIRPSLTDRRGQVWFTTTPKGEDWVYEELWQRAEQNRPGYWACRFKSLDNPKITAEEIAEERDTMLPEMFRQEYEASFETFTGAIYGELVGGATIDGTDEQMRVYIPEWPRIDPTRQVVGGVDPGADHPFAGVMLLPTSKGIVVIGEYEERNRPFAIHATEMLRLKRGLPGRIGRDRSAPQAGIELAQYGLYTVDAENDVLAGIQRVASWLVTKKLILPKRYCPRLISQLKSYRWAETEKKDGSKGQELVYKKRDDLCDALRYALMTWPELPKPRVQDSRRDLSEMPHDMREQIERMRRIEELEARRESGEDVESATLESVVGDFCVEGASW